MKSLKVLIVLIAFFSNAQEKNVLLAIDYYHATHFKSMPTEIKVNAFLTYNGIHSSYEMDYTGTSSQSDEEVDISEGQIMFKVKSDKNPILYKDFSSKEIYSIERIVLKPFEVKDSFEIFNWSLKDEYKTILGYKCQMAIMSFRGRDYVAYFTTDLPFSIGPWKFEGLPGVILEVYSLDNVFKIKANTIDVKNVVAEVPLRFNLKKAISWEEFQEKYTKKYYEMQSYTDESGGSTTIPKMKIERIVDE
ncbi:MAG: GLPGLI family protein [Winogradskyella sp.]|uniref:GLPGLI family protein n=1 Tax=Winogradskyella sp. TaxID=1883156 RepID=UPI0017B6A434|nr:GLPGLI family protein [Winogradskyella sp.]MBT8244835.1 GLPGLI family protein [Winogradskyella sp.]NNK23837.1 GLPGLI family protein [Winogradskyella sp.]